MANKQTTIEIDAGRQGRDVPVGINGIITRVPAGRPVTVDDAVLDVLTSSSIPFKVIDEGGGAKGGVRSEPLPEPLPVLSPEHETTFNPSMEPKTPVGGSAGGLESGDATLAPEPPKDAGEPKTLSEMLNDRSETADAAVRRELDAPVLNTGPRLPATPLAASEASAPKTAKSKK